MVRAKKSQRVEPLAVAVAVAGSQAAPPSAPGPTEHEGVATERSDLLISLSSGKGK